MVLIQIVLLLLAAPLVIDAIRRSGLERVTLNDLAIWTALTVFVFAALLLTRNMPEGVTLQYSGAAFLALTVGYSRAVLSMILLLFITQPWSGLGQSLLVDAVLPVWLMVWLVALSRRFLPANPFSFLLGCSFFGLFIVYAVQECVDAGLTALFTGQPAISAMFFEQTSWGLLLAGGEATLEGMVITVLVVFLPRAVYLFDDEFYLSRPM